VTAPLTGDVFLSGIAHDPRLSGIASCLLDALAVPFGCTYFVKEPAHGLPALWHQDGYPWQTQLGITRAVTLWIALDPAHEDNGCLRVIPGSHTLAAEPLRLRPDYPSLFGAEIDPDLVEAGRARSLILTPGDASAHHPNLIHSSLSNRSAHPRRALAVRYRPV
jgi:ectoine hydroxylase-related dioxygenase (phytanoyl-CoA dioxygenase family)